jgi:hypothetical protein
VTVDQAQRTFLGGQVKKIAVILSLAFLCLPLFGRDIQVTIVDKDLMSPLEGVTLSVPDGPIVKTDAQGRVVLTIPDAAGRLRLTASLLGYETEKVWLEPSQTTLNLALSLAGEIEGSELVVERNKPQKTDEQPGVSQVATSDEIQNTGSMGIIEDVMSTIKTLPGVGFVGDFNALPSIQGGAPAETKAVLDGAEVLDPYQWGGAVSIFDPNMVDSAKLSDGLISARYGDVISGMLEINSKTPASDTPQFDVDLSTSALDAFAQVPLGSNAGLLLGGKVTYLGLLFPLLLPLVGSNPDTYSPAPFIDNGYSRFFWKPSPNLEWDVNAFFGHDGVGENTDVTDSGLTTNTVFNYDNLFGFASSKLSALIDPTDLLTVEAAYNRLDQTVNGNIDTTGTETTTGSVINNLTDTIKEDTLVDSYQVSTSLDHQLAPGQVLSFGLNAKLMDSNYQSNTSIWTDDSSTSTYQLVDQVSSLDVTDNYELTSGAFALWEFGSSTSLLSGELGVRVDHAYLFSDEVTINTYPVVNPRARLVYTPIANAGWISSLSLIGGSGLYSQMEMDTNLFEKSMNIQNYQIGPDKAWFNSLGVEVKTDDGWKFSVEGYGKYYFDRLYIVEDTKSATTTNYIVHTDGTGLSLGVDVMLQKRLSRYWDGYLTYSFNDTRLKNPANPTYSGETTVDGDPLGIDYYPSYQQFHIVHLVSDWKPVDGFSIMVDASLATGTPELSLGAIQSYQSQYDGEPITRYAQTSTYSDTLRSGCAFPVDLKLSWFGYYGHSSVRWEYYFAIEDVFASFYSPQTTPTLNHWTGQTTSTSANYSLGFPLPSFGYKLSF